MGANPVIITKGIVTHSNGEKGVVLSGGFYAVGKAYALADADRDRLAIIHYGYGREASQEEMKLVLDSSHSNTLDAEPVESTIEETERKEDGQTTYSRKKLSRQHAE